MKCKYSRLINRYFDNELPQEKKEFIKNHIDSCGYCGKELKNLSAIKENICQNKIGTNDEFFWQTLKSRIDREKQTQAQPQRLVLEPSALIKKLIPVPILATILVVALLNLSQQYYNPIDEYIFDKTEQLLFEKPENQSTVDMLLYQDQ